MPRPKKSKKTQEEEVLQPTEEETELSEEPKEQEAALVEIPEETPQEEETKEEVPVELPPYVPPKPPKIKSVRRVKAIAKVVEILNTFVENDPKFSKVNVSLVEEVLKAKTANLLPRTLNMDCFAELVRNQLNLLKYKNKDPIDNTLCINSLYSTFFTIFTLSRHLKNCAITEKLYIFLTWFGIGAFIFFFIA